MYTDLLLEERYKQLETNFKAIVADLQTRPNWDKAPSLDDLLARLDTELKHALMRQQASSMSAPQRLEERTAILQRTFKDVVELMGEPSSSTPPSTPGRDAATASPRSMAAAAPISASSPSTGAGVAEAPTCSPHLPSHPWGGGAYSNPPAVGSTAASNPSPPTGRRGNGPPSPNTLRRYDSFPSYGAQPGGSSTAPSASSASLGLPFLTSAAEVGLPAVPPPGGGAAGGGADAAALAELARLRGLESDLRARLEAAGTALQAERAARAAVEDRASASQAAASQAAAGLSARLEQAEARNAELEKTLEQKGHALEEQAKALAAGGQSGDEAAAAAAAEVAAAEAARAAAAAEAERQAAAARAAEAATAQAETAKEAAEAAAAKALGRVPELETELEQLRQAERYASLQAQMQSKRAEENEREAVVLQERLEALSLATPPPAAAPPPAPEPPASTEASGGTAAAVPGAPLQPNTAPNTGRSSGGAVPGAPTEEAGAMPGASAELFCIFSTCPC